jgi:carotenoid cleavage dioxygenase-like enzyme
MPVINARFAMRKLRHFWFGTSHPKLGPMLAPGPCHFDEETGKFEHFYAGLESSSEEPCFVPRRGGSVEGDGWLLSIVGRRSESRSDLVILDARASSRGPVAVVKFPCRVHEGFHGIFVPEAAL